MLYQMIDWAKIWLEAFLFEFILAWRNGSPPSLKSRLKQLTQEVKTSFGLQIYTNSVLGLLIGDFLANFTGIMYNPQLIISDLVVNYGQELVSNLIPMA